MDFRLTDDQAALRDGLRELLAGRFGAEALRAAVAGGGTGGLWRELTGAGLFSLRRPEAGGGLALGMAEAVLAFEEAGRALVPGPLVATELASAHGLLPDGPLSHGLSADGPAPSAGVLRVPSGRGPLLVEALPQLDVLVLLDVAADSVRLLRPDELSGRAVRSVDPLTALWEVDQPADGAGRSAPAAADPGRLWTEGTLLTAALQVGLAGRAMDSAVGYAAVREQFGRPIGAFQAVQHLCADMLARTEPARVAVRAAAVALDAGEPWTEVEVAVAGAKLLADEAAVRGARDCLQVHGGMGFTWEAEVHLLLKRAWVWERSFAGAAECAETVACATLLG